MIPKLGQGIIKKARGASLKPLLTATNQYVMRTAPLTPALTVRSFSIQLSKQAEAVTDNTPPSIDPTLTKKITEEQAAELVDILKEQHKLGDLKGAIKAVQAANKLGYATKESYITLLNVLRDSPFDVESCAIVANWFYSPDSNIRSETLNDIEVWKGVLKLGLRFGSTYRSEDLRALVDRFQQIFDLNTLNDEAWGLLVRAYGILKKPEEITALLSKREGNEKDQAELYASALLAYAATNSHENVEKMLGKLNDNNALDKHTLLKLIRTYGFNGDTTRTSNYINMYNSMYPENSSSKTMMLIAHKVALQKVYNELAKHRGIRGLYLKPRESPELDQLHASWSELTKDMFSDDSQPVDITDCNIVLEYLTLANRIDCHQYPMEKAEKIFKSYMPEHNIQPNDATFNIVLKGYATTQQYNEPEKNVRLDKTLEVVSKMQEAGIDTLTHPTFHSLFRACLPHQNENYYFDNFRLNSLLPARPYENYQFQLDKRTFSIEQIMTKARLPHDRFTLTTLMTCFAAGGYTKPLFNRWNSMKYHGIRRDIGMYRLMFALCSLNPEAAGRAIDVVRREMKREIHKSNVDWDTNVAMLECCVLSNAKEEAKTIMDDMLHRANIMDKNDDRRKKLKFPYKNDPDFFVPFLRTSIALGLDSDQLVKRIEDGNIVHNQGIWEGLLSKAALEGNPQEIQRIFNKYTMDRWEKEGKMPLPVRDGSKPVIPFPTAPYNKLDMKFIDVFMGSLLDLQDISLVMDVFRTLDTQTKDFGVSRDTLVGIARLGLREKAKDDMKWFMKNVLLRLTDTNKQIRDTVRQVEKFTQ